MKNRWFLLLVILFLIGCSLGCTTSVFTTKNIMAGFEAMYIAEKISEMPDATDWKIQVIVENSSGSLSFIGNGDTLEDAAKELPNNLDFALPPMNIIVPAINTLN